MAPIIYHRGQCITLRVCHFSVEPEVSQEEVSVTPEPQPEPEPEMEPEAAPVELKQDSASQVEPLTVEKSPRAPPSPTPVESAASAPDENRVCAHSSYSPSLHIEAWNLSRRLFVF